MTQPMNMESPMEQICNLLAICNPFLFLLVVEKFGHMMNEVVEFETPFAFLSFSLRRRPSLRF